MSPAAKRLRQKRRRADARLNRHQIIAAYKLYRAGYSVPELSARGWEEWGHANQHQAQMALYRAFTIEGFARRSLSEVRRDETCSACGCSADARTVACPACRVRHSKRKMKGMPYVAAPQRNNCSGCGVALDERTRGCAQCINRHGRRNRKHRKH